MRGRWPLILVAAFVAGAVNWYLFEREIHHPPGIMVTQEPRVLPSHRPSWTGDAGLGYQSLGHLVIRARLLGRSNVTLSGWASISPVDLGLGWREMSDSQIIEQLDIGQYNAPIGGTRFLSFHVRRGTEIATWPRPRLATLFSQLTHVHAIPANQDIERTLRRLRPGQLLQLEGELVRVTNPNGQVLLTSSTVLGDSDCEILWVEAIELGR